METIKHSGIGLVNHSNVTSNTWFNRQVEKFEAARFGWMAMFIVIQSCLGSVACMYILKNNASDIMLLTCAIITMASSGRLCLAFFYTSLILNTIFLLLNI
jgi:hypothetical protein